MIEVEIAFSEANGSGILSYFVNVTPGNYGFDTQTYQDTILCALKKFASTHHECMITHIKTHKIDTEQVLELR